MGVRKKLGGIVHFRARCGAGALPRPPAMTSRCTYAVAGAAGYSRGLLVRKADASAPIRTRGPGAKTVNSMESHHRPGETGTDRRTGHFPPPRAHDANAKDMQSPSTWRLGPAGGPSVPRIAAHKATAAVQPARLRAALPPPRPDVPRETQREAWKKSPDWPPYDVILPPGSVLQKVSSPLSFHPAPCRLKQPSPPTPLPNPKSAGLALAARTNVLP